MPCPRREVIIYKCFYERKNMQARVYQLNVKKETLEERGIPKGAIETLKITKEGCEGDYNRYRTEKKQSDPHKAVMILTKEIIEELNKEGWPIEPGDLGENITLEGIPYEDLQPKTQIKIDKVLLEITQACTPCTNLRVLA